MNKIDCKNNNVIIIVRMVPVVSRTQGDFGSNHLSPRDCGSKENSKLIPNYWVEPTPCKKLGGNGAFK